GLEQESGGAGREVERRQGGGVEALPSGGPGHDGRADEDVEGDFVDGGAPGQEMGRRVDVGAGVGAAHQPGDGGGVAGVEAGDGLDADRRVARPDRRGRPDGPGDVDDHDAYGTGAGNPVRLAVECLPSTISSRSRPTTAPLTGCATAEPPCRSGPSSTPGGPPMPTSSAAGPRWAPG